MSFVMSGIITAVNTGLDHGFMVRWLLAAFPVAWVCAVPLAVVASITMPRIMRRLIRAPGA